MAKLMLILINAFYLFNLLLIVSSRKECVHRDYGMGSTVCVCNDTYCDNLDPIEKLPISNNISTILLYESSKSGDRFKESKFSINGTTATNATKSQTVTVDRKKKFQKIIGFGGAFTDASGINIASLPHNMQTNIIHDYYGIHGIEYSTGRIPIGGSDFSTRAYSYDDHENDYNLTLFDLAKEDHLYKIPYLQLAQQISPHKPKWFGSPWAPPAWMKNNSQVNHGGFLKGSPGGQFYKIFAEYFVKFLDAYKLHGLSMWGITIENEPGAGKDLNFPWNCLGFTPELERDFIKMDLGPTLEKAGYGKDVLKVMIFDDQRPQLVEWADTIFNDKEAAQFVHGIAYHWYVSNDGNLKNLDVVHEAHPDFFILSTEACEEWKGKQQHTSLGNWATAERYSYDIITNLQHWTTGWVDWNLVLDLQGGPNWVKNYVDAPILVNATAYEYYKQPFFYILGHFSKFLPPDSVKIQLTPDKKVDKFETVAFQRPDNGIVIIAVNYNDDPVTLKIHDAAGNINGINGREVKPHSIQTYIYWDVY